MAETRISGWLSKWKNEVGGYVKMWFVLCNGIFSCYSNQNETECLGEMSLCGAVINFDDTRKFIVCRDGEAFHLKADDDEDKQRWVEALISSRESLSADTGRLSSSGFGSEIQEYERPQDPYPVSRNPASALQQDSNQTRTLQQDSNQTSTLQQDSNQTSTLQQDSNQTSTLQQDSNPARALQEDSNPTSILRQDSNPLNTLQKDSQAESSFTPTTWSLDGLNFDFSELDAVKNCSDAMSECCNTLQRTITTLKTYSKNGHPIPDQFECQSRASALAIACKECITLAEYMSIRRASSEQEYKLEKIVETLTQAQSNSPRSSEDESFEYFDCCDAHDGNSTEIVQVYHVDALKPSGSQRRTRIPHRPNVSDNLWSILKNCISTDLSRMPLPVSFAEPLSMLQRLTEDFEYSFVLDKAAECADAGEQMAYVSAFISSSYSTTVGRSGKPFNPLLGETYECDRQSDLGWRSIAEQVSHHPPVAAIHCEGKAWEVDMDQSMKSKFKGTTLTIVPLGECHLKFKNGNRYTWKKPNTSIHNLIVGKLWVEQEGDVDIKCFTSHVTCKLTFMSSGWFGETFSIKGVVKDGSGNAVYDVIGKYTTQIEFRPAGAKDPGTVIWKRTEPPSDSSKYYNFTVLACQLNEMEDGVAPTDSRHRPDQRFMEEGKFDDANAMKKRLEEFQRANKKENWTPAWFKLHKHPDTHKEVWKYDGHYWQCKAKKDWTRCPAYIFNPHDTT